MISQPDTNVNFDHVDIESTLLSSSLYCNNEKNYRTNQPTNRKAEMYLPYLYQRPWLSSGRKLTKEYAFYTITLATREARREKKTRVQTAALLNP
jgi:hypothetical protein